MAGSRSLGTLTLQMILDVGQYEAGMNRAERANDKLEQSNKRREASDARFIQGLQAQADAIGKSKIELLELAAAQRKLSEQAAPIIASIKAQEAALDAAANAQKRLAGNADFVASLKSQSEAIGKSKIDLLEMEAAQRGLTASSAPYIASLRAQEKALLDKAAAQKKAAEEDAFAQRVQNLQFSLQQQKLSGNAPTKAQSLFNEAQQSGLGDKFGATLVGLQAQERALQAVAAAEQTAANNKSFLDSLDQMASKSNKSKIELLELEAAQRGLSKQALPVINQIKAQDIAASDNAFIKGLQRQSDAITKTRSEILALEAAERGLSAQAAPLIANIKAQEDAYTRATKQVNAYGMTKAAVRAAERNVPAQLTDIVVGLSTGQAPFTVLLQQGGQLKDMFGGIKPAAEALGRVFISALVNPITLTIGTIAALGYAFYTAKEQAKEFQASIVFTGNASGQTVGSLTGLSDDLKKQGVLNGTANEIINSLVQSGKVGKESLDNVAKAVTNLSKYSGQEIPKIVSDFVRLSEEPAKASAKLNEQYHFLTVATYDQIKAMEEEGNKAGAAALAQKAYADAVNSRTKEITDNLDNISKAWLKVISATNEALGLIQFAFSKNTLGEDYVKLEGELAAIQKRVKSPNILDSFFTDADNKRAGEIIVRLKEIEKAYKDSLEAPGKAAKTASETQNRIFSQSEIDKVAKAAKGTNEYAEALGNYRKQLEIIRAVPAEKRTEKEQKSLDPKEIAFNEAYLKKKFTPKGAKGPKDDDTKKNLDNQLKDLERSIKAEEDLYNQRNKFLDFYNQQGLISIKDYYDAKDTIQSEAVTQQRARLQEELDIVQKQIASTPNQKGNKVDLAELRGKENEIIDKQIKLEQDNAFKTVYAAAEKIKAQKAYQDSLKDVQAQLAEMNQDLAKAAGIRFDLANEGKVKQFTAEGNPQALADIARLREYGQAQAEINALQAKFSLAQGDLQIQTERFDLAYKRGLLGETEYYTKIGEANKRAYDTTSAQIANFDKLKQSMTLTPEQLQQYDRLKLQLDQLGASLDPLADKFNTLFDDSLGNFFADIGSGTKTAKDAFKDMFKTFSNEILKISGKDLAAQFRKAFGGEGGFDIGKSISDTFKSGNGNNIFEDVKKLFSGGGSGSSGGGIGGFFDSIKKSLGLGDAAKSLSTAADSWDFGAAKTASTATDSWDFGSAAKTGESGIMSLFKDTTAATSMTALGTSAITASGAITAMSAAASAAASALATVAASSAGSSIASGLKGFGSGDGFASWGTGTGTNFDSWSFDSGGFTGTGGRLQPAGIVHKGEYVMDANTTRRLGLNTLDALSRGASPGGGGTSVVQNINVLPGATRETGYQAARASTRELIRSSGR